MKMKTGKLLMLVICGVLHCSVMSMSGTTSRRLAQYEIAVMIGGYINPHQVRQISNSSCNPSRSRCDNMCCDGHAGSEVCRRCDSFFTYCLRNVDTATLSAGCPEGGNILKSDINPNDTSIDFSQNPVLGLDNPLIFQGLDYTWNGVQLYVTIWDQDPDSSQLIDIITWNITQPIGDPSGIMNLTGLYEIVTMEVNITVLCVPGFTGNMCDKDIDDCVGVSCSGNGQCMDGVNSFTCICAPGFTGALCTETDECVSVTCSGRGRCVDGVASYVCDCYAGYSGKNCEINFDDCLSNPCGEGGQCMNGVDSFTCMCYPGFTGELCQIKISDCAGVSCNGNGERIDDVNNFKYEHIPGYRGTLCAEGPTVGGILGACVERTLILILMVVVVLIMRGRKRPGKDVQGRYKICPNLCNNSTSY